MPSFHGPVIVDICRDPDCVDIAYPEYQTEGSSGMDLRAAVAAPLTLEPGAFAMVPTGLRIGLPRGYEAQIRPRSGLALRHGIGILNAPGTIDSDYRGPLNVILFNFSKEPFLIQRGDRIAQIVVARVEKIAWAQKPDLSATARGDGGFGHTGLR